MRSLALVLVALTLAGCTTEGTFLAPAVLAPGAVPLTFGDVLAMAQPTGGAEPNIAIATDGTMFITAVAGSQERPNAMQGAAWLWRSKDGGETWETLRAPQRDTPLGTVPQTRRPFGSSDADVVASADGWVYYSDWWNWGAPVTAPGSPTNARYGSYVVEATKDGGSTWTSAPVTTLDSIGGIDRQWLVPGEAGRVGLFYAYFHGQQNTLRGLGDAQGRADGIMSIQAVWSEDHAASWSRPLTVVPPIPGHDYQIGHPRYVGNGTYVMPYGDTEGSTEFWHAPSKVMLAVSRDNGTSWYPREVARAPQGFDNLWAVQADVDDAGIVTVAWAARAGESTTVFVSDSADLGDSWSEPLALTSGGNHFLPWVAARGDGEVAVGWYGGDTVGASSAAPAEAEWFAFVAHRAARDAPFAVSKASEEPVKMGPLCPQGAACGGDRELLDYFSLEFDADGKLHVAFAKSRLVDGVKAGNVAYVGAMN